MILKKYDKIISSQLEIVVLGNTKDAYLGRLEFKGEPVGQCSLLKEIMENHDYTKNIQIVRGSE